MISEYELLILIKLVKMYEKSKTFQGENKVRQRFIIKPEDAVGAYGDHSNYEAFQNLNDSIDKLIKKGFVNAKINYKNRVCSEIELCQDKIEDICEYLGMQSKKNTHDQLLHILADYKDKNDILKRFCSTQEENIRANKSVRYYKENITEFINILTAVDEILKVPTETFVRDFSVRLFRDSKIFDQISSKVVGLLFEYGDFPDKERVLGDLNIVKNPTYVNCKGNGIVDFSGNTVDLRTIRGDIAFSSEALTDISTVRICGKTVITIENLTTFHSTKPWDAFLIYLGGFHNSVRREFIRKIHDQNPDALFYHFGDIDAGGFQILDHLRRKTGVSFEAYKMDIATIEEYQAYSRELTDNDRARLNKMKDGEFSDLINYMLQHNCKLEQEAINMA